MAERRVSVGENRWREREPFYVTCIQEGIAGSMNRTDQEMPCITVEKHSRQREEAAEEADSVEFIVEHGECRHK